EVGARTRKHHRVAGPDARRVGDEEHQRLAGHLVAELLGVVGVVATDPDDLAAWDDWREQPDVLERQLPLARDQADIERVTMQGPDQLAAGFSLDDAVCRVL